MRKNIDAKTFGDLKEKQVLVPRLRLHEAFQFLVLTKQTNTKASSKIKIYSKYDVSGRLQNDSSRDKKIRIENVSEEVEVDRPQRYSRDASSGKAKRRDENVKEEQWEAGEKPRSIIITRENGKKTTKKSLKDNRRGNQIKKVKFE